MKRRRGVAAILVALLAAAAFVAAGSRPADPALFPPKAGERTVTVYVIYNWMHARLVVPTAALETSPVTAAALSRVPKEPWTAVSYGDARFYAERGWTPRRAVDFVRSMLRPGNPASVLVDPMPQRPSPETLGRHAVRLTLGERGFEHLRRRLDATFQLEAGRPIVIGRGRSPDSLFFQSAKGADLTHQCNHWVAQLLNAAGVPVNLVISTLTSGLAWDLQRRAGAAPVPGELKPAVEGLETPPVYSGTFNPIMRRVDERTGAVTFEAFTIRFGRGQRLVTRPERLAFAAERRPGGESYAALLGVPKDSLVEIRRVDLETDGGAPGLCGDRPTQQVVLGFWTRPRAPYEISMAAFAAGPPSPASLCGVFHYEQP